MVAQKLDSMLRRGVAEVIIEQELVKLLETGRPLRLKQGFDPSCPDIHLGHVVGLRKLRQFQDRGHQVILIVGDWTAQIGDPSGQSVTRPMLSPEEVKANAETYMKQFFKVVDKEKTQVRWQSEWFGEFNLSEVIKLTSKFTVAQLLAREDFNKRYTTGRPIAITELLYPLLQAYDSVVIEADVEFGGIDQKFNCLLGRELQAMTGQTSQQVLLVPLLVGTDGNMKMSKSLGNYIGIDESVNDMYGKVMSIPDELIMPYFELVTDVPDNELAEYRQELDDQSVNPMLLKKRIAREIVAQFYSVQVAGEAEKHFEKVIQKKEVPEEVIEVRVSFQNAPTKVQTMFIAMPDERQQVIEQLKKEPTHMLAPLLVDIGLTNSISEGRRLIGQGAIKIDGKIIKEGMVSLHDGMVIQRGKHRFVKIVNADK